MKKDKKTKVAKVLAKLAKGRDLDKCDKTILLNYCACCYASCKESVNTPSGNVFMIKIKDKDTTITIMNIYMSFFLVALKHNKKLKIVFVYGQESEFREMMEIFALKKLKETSTRKFYMKDKFLLDKIKSLL